MGEEIHVNTATWESGVGSQMHAQHILEAQREQTGGRLPTHGYGMILPKYTHSPVPLPPSNTVKGIIGGVGFWGNVVQTSCHHRARLLCVDSQATTFLQPSFYFAVFFYIAENIRGFFRVLDAERRGA